MARSNTGSGTLIVNAPLLCEEWDPVVDSTAGKFTAISLIPYYTTTGLIIRSSGKPLLIGYCLDSPRDVLKNVFENYHVTRYNGYELFGQNDLESTTPMLGLGIHPVEPPRVYGIEYNGKLEELLRLDGLSGAKRNSPISSQYIQRIISHLGEISHMGFMNPKYGQLKHDKQEIIDVLKTFS